MKRLYQITEVPTPYGFNRNRAAELFAKIHETRKVFAAFVETVKRQRINVPTGEAQYAIQDLKKAYQQEMMKGRKRFEVSREFMGDRIAISFGAGGHSLADAVSEIRSRVRRARENNRYHGDALKQRPTGFYLKKYQENWFKKTKRPTSDVEFTGIEIECIMPSNLDFAPLLPFAKWINIGHDGSIECNDSREEGREIRVCIERSEVRNVLPGLMTALKSLGAYVNRSCGLHVHLDQRRASDPALTFQKLVRSLGLLYTVVPASRRNNTYCKRNRHANWDAARNAGRYKAVNATAYDRYQTIEVRLFGGTLEAEKIINWIETLWAIVNGEIVMRCPKNFDLAARHWKLSEENIAWLKARQIKFADLNNALAPTTESETEERQAILEERREENSDVYCEHCDVTGEHDSSDCEEFAEAV